MSITMAKAQVSLWAFMVCTDNLIL